MRSSNGRRVRDLSSVQKTGLVVCATEAEYQGGIPSTALLKSKARLSPTSTYSLRSAPSSSVSPGIMDPSVERGFGLSGRFVTRDGLCGRSEGGNCSLFRW